MRSLAFVLSSYSTVNMLLEVSSWSVCLFARLSTAHRLAIQHTIHLSTSYPKPVSVQIARSLGRLRSVRDLLSKVAETSRKENTEVEDAQGEEIRHAFLPRRDDLAGGCGLSRAREHFHVGPSLWRLSHNQDTSKGHRKATQNRRRK